LIKPRRRPVSRTMPDPRPGRFPEARGGPPHPRRACRGAPPRPLSGSGDVRRGRPSPSAPQRLRRSAAPAREEGGLLTLAVRGGYERPHFARHCLFSAARDANNKEWRGGRPALFRPSSR